MADLLKQLPDLPEALAVDLADLLHIRNGSTDKRITYDNFVGFHINDTTNPHQVTKAQIGLGNLTGNFVLEQDNNLSDVENVATSRTNLSVPSISDLTNHTSDTSNPHQVTKAQIGLGNLTGEFVLERDNNLSDVPNTTAARANLSVPSLLEFNNHVTDLNTHVSDNTNPHQVTKAQIGLGNLTGNLVLEQANNLSDVPSKGTARSNLSVPSLSVFNSHVADNTNPHQVTKAQIGLGNLTGEYVLERDNNLSDVPSKATGRANLSVPSLSAFNNHTSDTSNPHQVTKAQIGLGNLTGNLVLEQTNNLSDVPNKATGRANLGVPSVADLNSLVPAGVVVMWSGSSNSIPSGWALCDGSSGRPDLRGKFAIGSTGTSGTYPDGSIGGAASSSHAHSSSIHGHSLTVNQIPEHAHDSGWGEGYGAPFGVSPIRPNRNQYGSGDTDRDNYGFLTSKTMFDSSNTGHSGAADVHAHGSTVNPTTTSNIPPYYSLAYIIKL